MGICGIYVRTSVETDGTSIEQQTELGIKFCNAQNFQYQVYEDIGKSGYKIDDDNDPFKNRPGMAQLIDDIEKNVIDKVWVWEYSRLSRNELASYVLRNIFIKNKIVVYENGKQFNMDDPLSIMIDGILTHVSRYERNNITGRTTRGIHDRINTGRRSYVSVYGYRQVGKVGKFLAWKPVQSEIENIKYAFREFLQGKSINSIVRTLHNELPEVKLKALHKNYRNALFRFDYTGFSLTTEGLELYHKYRSCETDNLDFLKEQENGKPKYYLPSINYNIQIVTVEDWVTVIKKLRENKEIYKTRKRYASSDIFSGIINCPYCGLNYYSYSKDDYNYYTHIPSKKCLQRPKSVRREKMNNLVKIFFFYFYLVYDDTKALIKESQKLMQLNQIKIKEQIKSTEAENKKMEKQIERFQVVYEETNDVDLLKLTLIKEKELNAKKSVNLELLNKLNIDLEDLNRKYESDKMELTYYDTKNVIVNFFENMVVEQKRAALIKVIKNCQLFGNYLLIDTGKLLFIFNVKEEYIVTDKLYEQFKKDDYFKINFLVPSKSAESVSSNVKIVSTTNFLVRETGQVVYRYEIKKSGELIKKAFAEKNIKYDLTGIESIISFTEL